MYIVNERGEKRVESSRVESVCVFVFFETELREHCTGVFNLNLNVNCAWGSAKRVG